MTGKQTPRAFSDRRALPDIRVLDHESTSAAGVGRAALARSLREQASGLVPNNIPHSSLATWIGRVPAIDDYDWTESQRRWQSRNNALAAIGLEQGTLKATLDRVKRAFTSDRIGIVMGSSTSSIDRTELAYRHLTAEQRVQPQYRQAQVHNPHAPGLFVAHHTGITGPVMTINTACSSSAKVFATGARWLACGIADAVLVGGVDTLCLSVIHGFHSLQLVSAHPCRPFDEHRDGINLGEAAGFAILVRPDFPGAESALRLSGFGESSDAHHMSHPHPEGEGARQAINTALQVAGLSPDNIDYINLHGTASRANDLIEGKLIGDMFDPAKTAISSTKGWTGHTLGAAGITEAIIAMEALRHSLVPGTLNLEELDKELDLPMSARNSDKSMTHVMTNSFGFGGNNCCLIFSGSFD